MSFFGPMQDMAMDVVEVKETIEKSVPSPGKASAPRYPYGLCISLDETTMAKLKLDVDDLPEVGECIHLCGMAKVTSVSQNETTSEDGTARKCCRVELQITNLATESENEENDEFEAAETKTKARRSRMYGDSADAA